jgi:hypothetical protein
MLTALHFITLIGLGYLCILIATYKPETRAHYRERYRPAVLIHKFHSERLQQMMSNTGIEFASFQINFFRYLIVVSFIVINVISRFFRGDEMSFTPFMFGLIFIICTSPHRFTPWGRILTILRNRRLIKKDSQLISLLRLYENNKMKLQSFQLHAFFNRVSNHFNLIRSELLEVSERIIDQDIQDALDWWVQQYPADHQIMGQIRTILLLTEGMEDQHRAAEYIKSQSEYISKISSDQYKRRWNMIGDYAKVVNSIPSILTFVMIFALVLLYVNLIRSQMYTIN